jgi:hypothetical protein
MADRTPTTTDTPAGVLRLQRLAGVGAIKVCCGNGMADTRLEAERNYDLITWSAIVEMADDPPSRAKAKGKWIIPSTYNGPDARTHSEQLERGRFRLLVADIDGGNLDLDAVADAVEAALGGPHEALIYSTKSSTATDRRWRVLVAIARSLEGWQWLAVMGRLSEALKAVGVTPDGAMRRAAQFSYLPNEGIFYEAMHIGGPQFDPAGWTPDASMKPIESAEARAARMAAIPAPPQKPGIVGAWNRTNAICELLGRYGYTANGRSDDYRSPYQQSRNHATRDFRSHWVSHSESDAKAGIGRAVGGRAASDDFDATAIRHGDAFDLFVHFEHGGDYHSALAAAKAELAADGRKRVGADPGPYPFPIRPSVAATVSDLLNPHQIATKGSKS